MNWPPTRHQYCDPGLGTEKWFDCILATQGPFVLVVVNKSDSYIPWSTNDQHQILRFRYICFKISARPFNHDLSRIILHQSAVVVMHPKLKKESWQLGFIHRSPEHRCCCRYPEGIKRLKEIGNALRVNLQKRITREFSSPVSEVHNRNRYLKTVMRLIRGRYNRLQRSIELPRRQCETKLNYQKNTRLSWRDTE